MANRAKIGQPPIQPSAGVNRAQIDQPPTETSQPDDSDLLSEALDRYERGYNHDRDNIIEAYDDLAFCDTKNQWSAEDQKLREKRPQLTIDRIGQFVRQITGDMRQLRPAIKVVPVDDHASSHVADKVLPLLVRYIEQRSDATAAYFHAIDGQVRCGIGHWRVMTEYAGISTFLQEIRIAPINDGVQVIWDPDAILPTREDAAWCFVPIDIDRKKFAERWPDKSPNELMHGQQYETWSTKETVRVCEYYYKVPRVRQLAHMPDGSAEDVSDDQMRQAVLAVMGIPIEPRPDYQVMRCLMTCSDFLEGPEPWPGRYIPIVPLIGEELPQQRSCVRRGIVRPLKDAQRVYNFAISAQAEVVALQPKAPWLGTKKNFQDAIDKWETANVSNWPFLEYTPDSQNQGAAPARVAPPVGSPGTEDLCNRAAGDFNAVSGIYPPSLGQQSNETSGTAILARQREGDTGTFHYIDNFGRAMRYCGKIVVDLIPHIYDTARTIRVMGDDGVEQSVGINQPGVGKDGITPMLMNDLSVGTYEVAIEMGPSYSTKREEARDNMQTLIQAGGPQFAALFGDLYVKTQDFPLADQMARRLHMMLPPPVQAMEAAMSGGKLPPPPPPPPPSPEVQAKMAADARQQEIDHINAQAALAKVQKEVLQAELALVESRQKAAAGATAAAAVAGSPAPLVAGITATSAGAPSVDIADLVKQIDALSQIVLGIVPMLGGPSPNMPMPGGPPPGPPQTGPGGPPPGAPPMPGPMPRPNGGGPGGPGGPPL